MKLKQPHENAHLPLSNLLGLTSLSLTFLAIAAVSCKLSRVKISKLRDLKWSFVKGF